MSQNGQRLSRKGRLENWIGRACSAARTAKKGPTRTSMASGPDHMSTRGSLLGRRHQHGLSLLAAQQRQRFQFHIDILNARRRCAALVCGTDEFA